MILAMIAAALWAAAAWRDQVRYARQQPVARWAEAFDEAATTTGGKLQ